MTHDAFLQAIIDNPDDDAPRLVYAGWLERHGQPERAEFIRVQCELAELTRTNDQLHRLVDEERRGYMSRSQEDWLDVLRTRTAEENPRFGELQIRETALLSEYGKAWAGQVRGLASDYWFGRGFVEDIRLNAMDFLNAAHTLLRAAPIRHVRLQGASELASALSFFTPLARLRSLDLSFNGVGDVGVKALAESPYLARLERLNLTANQVSDAGLNALAGSPHLNRLTSLDLGDNHISDDGGRALAASPLAARLTHLDMSFSGIGDACVRALTDSMGPTRIASLNLLAAQVGSEGVERLAGWPHLAGLRALKLGGSNFESAAVCRLVSSPGMANMASLGLSDSRTDDEAARALASSPFVSSLTWLDLDNTHVGDEGAAALAESLHLSGLRFLTVGWLPSDERRLLLRERFGDRVHF